MIRRIEKLVNSQGIRIPKSLLQSGNFLEGDEVEIIAKTGKIFLEHSTDHKTIIERFKDYDGNYKCKEWVTDSPTGEEVL
jgi:antitoxin component of MazEF toxin-antitoxin module